MRATNRGVVALTGDFYYAGRVVYLDHGAGLVSVYMHLSAIDVAERDTVQAGQVIGRVGATGRVTGPHLHWGAKIGDRPFDPTALLDLSQLPNVPLPAPRHGPAFRHCSTMSDIDFDFDDASTFQDLESGEQIPVVPQSFRSEYRRLITEHTTRLATMFSEQRIDYALLNTREPLDRALFSYLSSREKLARVR